MPAANVGRRRAQVQPHLAGLRGQARRFKVGVGLEQGTMVAQPASFADAHRALFADTSIQFDLPAKAPEPPPPNWLISFFKALQHFFEWLSHEGPLVKTVFWIAVAAIVLLVAWRLWLVAARLFARWRDNPEGGDAVDWRPEAAPARALLAEADALAALGDYAEAAHLVLLRSVEQIGAQRPRMVRPALTSRDIAAIDGLPGDVAAAFAKIAGIVETGMFAARPVGADAWAQARAAYEAVAFPRAWA